MFCYLIAAKTNSTHKDKAVKKDNCPFCKEKKKKPLATYIRRRELCKRTESICEEEEEEDEAGEEEEEETNKSHEHSHKHGHVPADDKKSMNETNNQKKPDKS